MDAPTPSENTEAATSLASYVLINTVISALASVAMDCIMGFVVFHGKTVIPAWGLHGALVDAAPTVFMTTLMSAAVPAFSARKLLGLGRLAALAGRRRLPAHPIARAVIYGLAAVLIVCELATAFVVAFSVHHIGFGALLATKVLIGVTVPMLVTPLAIRATLCVE